MPERHPSDLEPKIDESVIKEQYLVDYLQEEFEKNPDIRVRVIEEDKERGVLVRSQSREYFFPFLWAMTSEGFKNVRELVQKIHSLL
jgi:hypothetical protein